MTTPGLYRHYKGNVYRVLFVAEWTAGAPSEDEVCAVFLESCADEDTPRLQVGARRGVQCVVSRYGRELFDTRWSGNRPACVKEHERVVIYVGLYGDGRVAARTEREFEEYIGEHDLNAVCRFERIGD